MHHIFLSRKELHRVPVLPAFHDPFFGGSLGPNRDLAALAFPFFGSARSHVGFLVGSLFKQLIRRNHQCDIANF